MANICDKCGKKIGYFSNAPLSIYYDEYVLCNECAQPIKNAIDILYYVKTTREFNDIKQKLITICDENYDDKAKQAVLKLADSLSQSKTFCDEGIEKEVYRKKHLENYMLTTGYDFHGYKICEYSGVISGQVVLGTGFLSEFTASFADFFGVESDKFANKLENAKNAALERLIVKSDAKGGNAIIGVDFDYITFHGNMIGVVANGTSVVIEKEE